MRTFLTLVALLFAVNLYAQKYYIIDDVGIADVDSTTEKVTGQSSWQMFFNLDIGAADSVMLSEKFYDQDLFAYTTEDTFVTSYADSVFSRVASFARNNYTEMKLFYYSFGDSSTTNLDVLTYVSPIFEIITGIDSVTSALPDTITFTGTFPKIRIENLSNYEISVSNTRLSGSHTVKADTPYTIEIKNIESPVIITSLEASSCGYAYQLIR